MRTQFVGSLDMEKPFLNNANNSITTLTQTRFIVTNKKPTAYSFAAGCLVNDDGSNIWRNTFKDFRKIKSKHF